MKLLKLEGRHAVRALRRWGGVGDEVNCVVVRAGRRHAAGLSKDVGVAFEDRTKGRVEGSEEGGVEGEG